MEDKIREIADKAVLENPDFTYNDIVKALREAYIEGYKNKRCKEENTNPYNIDYKRQTKLEL